jgi:hypothetical protein
VSPATAKLLLEAAQTAKGRFVPVARTNGLDLDDLVGRAIEDALRYEALGRRSAYDPSRCSTPVTYMGMLIRRRVHGALRSAWHSRGTLVGADWHDEPTQELQERVEDRQQVSRLLDLDAANWEAIEAAGQDSGSATPPKRGLPHRRFAGVVAGVSVQRAAEIESELLAALPASPRTIDPLGQGLLKDAHDSGNDLDELNERHGTSP